MHLLLAHIQHRCVCQAQDTLDNTFLELTHAHPHDVVVTLLHCTPSCDRYGAHLP